MMMMNKKRIYLDDLRTPIDGDWIIVRSFQEFVDKITEIGINNISTISLDHDLGDTAMNEYFTNVKYNYKIDYNNIKEKTGLDCAKWLIDHYLETKTDDGQFEFPTVYTHSANPIGAANIMGYVNNFLMNMGEQQTCVRVRIQHTVKQ